MEHTFFHKLIIAIVAGFLVASLFQFYKTFIIGADEAVNKGYSERYGVAGSER